jgi:K+-sensing histidine kinase KdpD
MNHVSSHRVTLKRCGLILAFAAAILATARLTLEFGAIANAPTAAFSFLILVLLSAFFGDFLVAVTTSVVATLCFNYFYLPPVGTFYIAAFADWISLAAFLLTAITISRLTSSAAENTAKADMLDKTMVQLREFGVWLLSVPHDRLTLSGIAEEATRIFSLEYCSIHVHIEGKWRHFTGAVASDLSREIANGLELFKDHPTNWMEMVDENALGVRYMQIKQGTTLLALLAVKSMTLPASAIGTLGYMIGGRLMEVMKDEQSFSRSTAQ